MTRSSISVVIAVVAVAVAVVVMALVILHVACGGWFVVFRGLARLFVALLKKGDGTLPSFLG
jgi:hypothetical protein